MAVFSIKDLEQLSGIKAHTIRIWEKRYGIIKPSRTAGNIRFYNEDDLKLLMNVSYLNNQGQKISKIARLSPNEIESQVSNFAAIRLEEDQKIDALTLSLLQLDKNKFMRVLDCNINQHGFEHTMTEVIYPLLEKLSMLWISGSTKTVQENFIVNLIKQKIIGAIENLEEEELNSGKHFLIYLPPGESQELSLLFMQYLIIKSGHQVINIGPGIEINHLKDVSSIIAPHYIFTIVNEPLSAQRNLDQYKTELLEMFPDSKILLTGFQVFLQEIQPHSQVMALNSLRETQSFLKSIA